MSLSWKNDYWLIIGYIFLSLGLINTFLFPSYHIKVFYIVAIVCTLFSVRRLHTLIISLAGLGVMFLDFYVLHEESNFSSLAIFLNLAFGIAFTCIIILLSKNLTNEAAMNLLKLESLFNYATIGIVVTDKEGIIRNFNKYAESQFGYTEQEVVGRCVEILIPTTFQARHIKHRENFYHHLQPRIMGAGRELYACNKAGEEFPVEVSLSYYKLGNETYVIAFVVDITLRKENEQVVLQQKVELEHTAFRIRQNNQELETKVESRTQLLKDALIELEKSKQELSDALEKEKELGDLKSRFVTMASHEFRTPLSTILSSADILEKYNTIDKNEKVEKQILRIKDCVIGMKTILEDFLSLGKLEEGTVKPKMELIEFRDYITEIEKLVQELQQIAKPGQVIAFHHSGESSVYTDRALVRNILTNLLSNAIKFSPENSCINVVCEVKDGLLNLVVTDKGIGISEEDQQHLFERFFRAPNAATIQGTGLGLHIIAKYVELMRGRIQIESNLGKGTSFIVELPNPILES